MKRERPAVSGTPTVNDWMVYLNNNYGQALPVNPPLALQILNAIWSLSTAIAVPTPPPGGPLPPLPAQVPIFGALSLNLPSGGTITLNNLALDLTPAGACAMEGTLAYAGTAGSASISLKSTNLVAFASAQFTFAAIKLADAWQILQAVFNDAKLGFPNLPGGIWSFLDNNLVLPTVWLPPSLSDLSGYFELQFQAPPSLAGEIGGVTVGNFTYSIEPNVLINSIIISYDPGAGLQLNTRVSISTSETPTPPPARGAVAGSPKTELVGFPPALPAQDVSGILKLTYLGLGQHVGPKTAVGDPDTADPLAAIFTELEGLLQGSDVAGILQTLANNFYQPDRNWFVAADFVLFDSFQLRVLINDPAFYGLEITATGGPWDGFLFEILYEKISSNLGAFYGALTLPNDMRYIPLDGFVLVLPGFSIWIYTNGDFRINVGWPIGGNSIGVLIGPLRGLAGFYIEKLRSADFPGAHPINFNPILGLGFGVQISISESVDAGIFSGGWYVGVGATFQGLIAWKQGGSSAFPIAKQPDHYWFAGTANLSILVWGDVDFGIVQASISASLSAGVGVAFETGYGTLIAVTASISASASVRVGFVHIHFSFSTSMRETFPIGGKPWASVSGPQGMGPTLLSTRMESVFARNLHRAEPLALLELKDRATRTSEGLATPASPIDVMFVLHPTAVYPGGAGQVNLVAGLAIECPAPGSPAGSPTPFERLVSQLIAWLMTRMTAPGNISDQLADIKKSYLGSAGSEPPGTMPGFVTDLIGYLQAKVTIRINSAATSDTNAALLPMFDMLTLTTPGLSPINFGSNVLPDNYVTAVRCYYQDLRATAFVNAGTLPPRSPVPNWSMAKYAFGDYFLLLCRHIIGALYASALYYEEQNPGATPSVELAALINAFDFASAAGIGSRFMLYGVQLPQPDQIPPNPTPANMASVPASPLYVLTGQQFQVPQSALGPGPTSTITASLSGSAAWITFASGNSVSTSIVVPNIAPNAPTPTWLTYSEGQTVPTPTGNQIAVAPLSSVLPQVLVFGLTASVDWVLPNAPHYTLYPLPQALCDLAQPNAIQLRLQIDESYQDPLQVGVVPSPPQPALSLPGLLIRLSVTKVLYQTSAGSPAQPGTTAYIPYVYQINATDDATRDLIYQALLDPSLAQAGITLLYTSTSGGTSTPSLHSDLLNANVLLVKNNLSVENQVASVSAVHMRRLAAITAADQPDSATLKDPVNFLRLIWEQSVVNTPGFMLYYETQTGEGLPDDIFIDSVSGTTISGSGGPTAEFDILVEFQNSPAVQSQVKSFVNCMVVEAAPVANTLLSAHAYDSAGNALSAYAPSYPPGTIGIELLWSPPIDSPSPPLVPVEDLYQLIQYQIAGTNGFSQSVWSLPIGPAASPVVGGLWTYQQTIPVVQFLGLPQPVNPYAVIGKAVELGLRTTDIYGNSLPSSQAVTLPCLYNDPLISIGNWQGVHADYVVSGAADPATLAITLHFDPRVLQPPSNPNPSEPPPSNDANTYWVRLSRQYQQIFDQLSDSNTTVEVTSSLAGGLSVGDPTAIQSALTQFVTSILQAIPNSSNGYTPGTVPDCVLSAPIPFASIRGLSIDIFEVTANVIFTRPNDSLIDPVAMAQLDAVKQVSFLVAAHTTAQGSTAADGNSGIASFALQFETAFENFDGQNGKLKIAQRLGGASGTSGAPSLGLWAVRISTSAGISIAPPVNPNTFGYFALAPLSKVPVSGTHTSQPIGLPLTTTKYTNVDLDLWAEQFLRAFDDLLSPRMAAAIAILDRLNGTQNYEQLAGVKRQLASVIALGVEAIFDSPPPGSLSEAQNALEQAMLVQLSNAYGVSTIVQIPTAVSVAGQADDGSSVPQFFGRFGPPPPTNGGSVSQPYVFSNATLDVAAGQQYLTSLLTVQTQPATPFLQLPLQYRITHLQHDFETAEAYYGYVPSSWLKFALDDELLTISIPQQGGSVTIPVPVPYLPTTPSLQSQTASEAVSSSPPGSSIDREIQDALGWNYDVTLSTELIPQDRLYFDVAYNQSAASLRALANVTALFDALAEYQELYPSAAQLNAIVDEAYAGTSGGAQQVIARILQIAEGVASAWQSHLALRGRRVVAAATTDHFFLTTTSAAPFTVQLYGQNDGGTGQPAQWPSRIALPNAQPWTNIASLTPQPTGDGWYLLSTTLPAQTSANPDAEFTWSNLDLLTEQNATFTCWIVRNSNLAGTFTQAINKDFVFETQKATFSTPGVPFIERETLGTIEPNGLSLDQILGEILQPFANVSGASINLCCSYRYVLVSDGAGSQINASKTLMRPIQLSVPANVSNLAGSIASEIRNLYADKPMPQTGALLNIGLSLSGTLAGTQTLLAQIDDIPIDISSVPSGWI